MSYKILTDLDVARSIDMPKAIEAIAIALRAKRSGNLISPARHHVEFGEKGSLTFTIGGILTSPNLAGFRVYDTFKGNSPQRNQFVAVFETTGAFKGIVIGELLGAMRTGAIGGLAIRLLSREDSKTVGIIGSGLQARTQLLAAAASRKICSVKVFSRNEENRQSFASEMSPRIGIEVVPTNSAKEAVHGVDILLCATTSSSPVFDPSWLSPGCHVNTVGPKFKGHSELDPKIAAVAKIIVSDSLEQMKSYPSDFFLAHTQKYEDIKDLSGFVDGELRRNPEDISLFCSTGLAGTEVLVAATLFD